MQIDRQINKKGLKEWRRKESVRRRRIHGQRNAIYRQKHPVTKKKWDGIVKRAKARVENRKKDEIRRGSLFSKVRSSVKNMFTRRKV